MNISIEQRAPTMEQINTEKESVERTLVNLESSFEKRNYRIRVFSYLIIAFSVFGIYILSQEVSFDIFFQGEPKVLFGLMVCLTIGGSALVAILNSYSDSLVYLFVSLIFSFGVFLVMPDAVGIIVSLFFSVFAATFIIIVGDAVLKGLTKHRGGVNTTHLRHSD